MYNGALRRSAAVTLRVVAADGRLAEPAHVALADWWAGGLKADPEGVFLVFVASGKDFVLKVSALDHLSADVAVDALEVGEERDLGDIRLDRGATLRVRTVDPQGLQSRVQSPPRGCKSNMLGGAVWTPIYLKRTSSRKKTWDVSIVRRKKHLKEIPRRELPSTWHRLSTRLYRSP